MTTMSWTPVNDAMDFVLAKTIPSFKVDEFRFSTDLPFGQQHICVLACVSYLIIVLGGRELMKAYKPFTLKQLVFVHNVIMSAGSLLLWILVLEQVVPMMFNNGFTYTMCNRAAYSPRLEFLYYLNYIFKLWEFIDTIFLVLKKRPLEFLHVYHHSATAAFAYLFLWKPISSAWVVLVLNLAVHVLMYYYYAVSTVSKRQIWWKKHLTTMQIVQFVLDIAMLAFMTYNVFINEYFVWVKDYGFKTVPGCYAADPVTQASVSAVLFGSYLILFIDFYSKTYKRDAAKRAASKKSAVNGNGYPADATSSNGITKEE
ncbi:very-long-chain 3-oxoacyl-CoA synthase [Synchytrium microbalum]|uniref:Elongation of fatty acids protein n=1 Tax=Synchytrium microbalum TaxID=1806994 RepID=A0A507BYE5_9FUNG|nr:very-long-chain 3-oxoacyl-CoA synthase [Synchytrium microbalum]TPX32452.1 very-long-chain 3-oxoacyl-CoA synthase [Synchytrium microbalum]